MPIARMKRINITGHESVRNDVISLLHAWGAVQVNDLRQELKGNYAEGARVDAAAGEKVLQVNYIMKFLERFGMKNSMMKIMSDGRAKVSKAKLEEVIGRQDIKDLYDKCRELERAFRDIDKEKAKANEQIGQLRPWVELGIKISEIKDTERVRVKAGMVALRRYKEFTSEICGNPGVEISEISADKKYVYTFLVYLREVDGIVDEAIRKYEFSQASFPEEDMPPLGTIHHIENSIKRLDSKLKELNEKASGLTSNHKDLNILYDHYINTADREVIKDCLAGTARSFYLSGWIKDKQAGKVKKELENKFEEVEVELEDPNKGEQVPIALDNKKLSEPLEFVTDLYGRPAYSGIDPTPFFSGFFLVFFAICITDAGYGIMLSLASLFVLRKYKMGPKGTHFWKMGFYGGLVTIVAGLLTGGWFGNTLDILPGLTGLKAFKNALMLIDPIEDAMVFLYFSLFLGYVQILYGLGIKMSMDIKNKDIKAALYDELSWMVTLLCVGLMIVGMILKIPWIASIGSYTALLALLVVVLFAGRKAKNVFGRVASGLYSLYDGVTGYFKDILSYSRLFALGLGTGIMAMAINSIIALIPSDSVVGIIVIALIFVGGHTFNFVMNLLSGYVHTSRLQYVEFFTKFYESGGKEFRPFTEKRKFTEIS